MDRKEYQKRLKQIQDSVYTPLEKLQRLTSLNSEYLSDLEPGEGGPDHSAEIKGMSKAISELRKDLDAMKKTS